MGHKMSLVLCLVFIAAATVSAQWSLDRKLSTTDSATTLNENMGTCLVTWGDTLHVVWCDTRNNGSAIYYKRSVDAGVTWGADTRLSATPGHAEFPAIACSGSTLHLVFRDTRGPQNASYYKRSLDGGATWEPEVFLDTAYWWPSVAASGSLVYVVLNDTFYTNGVSNSEVYFRRSLDNGANWGPVQRISNAAGRSEDPAIATDGAHVYLAWNDNRTGIMQSWFRHSSDSGATWSPEAQLTNSTVFAYSPMIDAYGQDIYVPWEDRRNNNNFDIYLIHSSDFGATWGVEERLTQDARVSAYPDIVRDNQNIHLVWLNMPGPLQYLHSGNAGASWDAAIPLVDSASQPMQPFVAVAGTVVHVIWTDMRDGHRAIYYKRNPTGNPGASAISRRDRAAQVPNSRFTATFSRGTLVAGFPGHDNTTFALYDIVGRRVRAFAGNRFTADCSPGTYIVRPEGLQAAPVRATNVE
jgi:hypothetical protein